MNARSKFTFRMARDERGVALPVALSILFLVAGLTSIAAKAGIVSDHFSFRDRNAKRAVQAANAGIEAAVYQLNLMQPASLQCVIKDVNTGTLQLTAGIPDNWCITQTEDLGDGASYTERAVHGVTSARQRPGDRAAQDRLHRHGQRHQAAGAGHTNAGPGQPLFAANYAASA